MLNNSKLRLPVTALVALAALALGLSACGYESHSKEVAEGHPVKLGELEYVVTFSRFLNPNDNEDVAYLEGQPEPPAGSAYFGVFFEVKNESKEPQALPSSMTVTDTDHNEFEALESESIFALQFGSEIEPEEQVPVLDSAAQLGAIEGALALFLIPAEASENRPLILHIPGPDGEEAEVELDL